MTTETTAPVTKILCLYTGRVLFEAAVETIRAALLLAVSQGADLSGADLSGAYLSGAYLKNAKLPSPTVLLLAYWEEVSPQLTADLMLYDASCHPDPDAFARWAAGGECPYSGVHVERAAHFKERKELWGTGVSCRPYDLMVRVLAEKCPEWNEEKRAAFEASFAKPAATTKLTTGAQPHSRRVS